MALDITVRGFAFDDFTDCFGHACSIQESSSATERRIWFGVKNHRMHLNQEQVKTLLPLLQTFVEHGRLTTPEGESLSIDPCLYCEGTLYEQTDGNKYWFFCNECSTETPAHHTLLDCIIQHNALYERMQITPEGYHVILDQIRDDLVGNHIPVQFAVASDLHIEASTLSDEAVQAIVDTLIAYMKQEPS